MSKRLLFLCGVAAALGACGGGSGPTTVPPPVPSPSPSPTPAAVRTVIDSRSVTINAGSALQFNVDDVPAGIIDARLDWQNAARDLNLYITDLDCTSILDLTGGRCRILAQGASSAKPETARITTTATGTYKIWSHNTSGANEPSTIEVGLTR